MTLGVACEWPEVTGVRCDMDLFGVRGMFWERQGCVLLINVAGLFLNGLRYKTQLITA